MGDDFVHNGDVFLSLHLNFISAKLPTKLI